MVMEMDPPVHSSFMTHSRATALALLTLTACEPDVFVDKEKRPLRHEQRIPPRNEDPYRLDAKLADPVECPTCQATYHEGRWTWHRHPGRVAQVKCPACRRIEDNVPAARVELGGAWFLDHRTDVLDRVLAVEARERTRHPMQRIVSMRDADGGVLVTTTDPHLARAIATALHDAFKGEAEMHYPAGGGVPFARWTR